MTPSESQVNSPTSVSVLTDVKAVTDGVRRNSSSPHCSWYASLDFVTNLTISSVSHPWSSPVVARFNSRIWHKFARFFHTNYPRLLDTSSRQWQTVQKYRAYPASAPSMRTWSKSALGARVKHVRNTCYCTKSCEENVRYAVFTVIINFIGIVYTTINFKH